MYKEYCVLDVWCDFVDRYHCYTFPERFECRSKAIAGGWFFRPDNKVMCRTCLERSCKEFSNSLTGGITHDQR